MMVDALPFHLDADDIIARIRAEMEEVIRLIQRPCPSGWGPAIVASHSLDVLAPSSLCCDQA